MYDCLKRMGGDINEISKIDAQIESFKSKYEFYSSQIEHQFYSSHQCFPSTILNSHTFHISSHNQL